MTDEPTDATGEGATRRDVAGSNLAESDATGSNHGKSDAVGGVDRRQLLLVGLCLGGLVVAAFLAPPPVSPSAPDAQQPRDPSAGGGGGGGGVPDTTSTPVPGEGNVLDGEAGPTSIPGGEAPGIDGCSVVVERRPVPGAEIPVGVYVDSRPVADARVWFDGVAVGRTDENGRVTGRVPYDRTLSVRVDAGDTDGCEFYREAYGGSPASANRSEGLDRQPAENALDPRDPAATVELAVAALAGDPLASVDLVDRLRPVTTRQNGPSTGNYTVYGRVNVTVVGDPYPGEPVTLQATVEGVPMRDATVSFDGETLGETDRRGRHDFPVPSREEAVVTVSRGDFAGEAVVDVLLLEATVQPGEGLPFPGESARVNVTVDDDPVAGVPVAAGGRRIGSTGANGTVGMDLHLSPGAAVSARTDRQVSRVPLWRVYAPTVANAALLAVLALGTTAGVARWRGPDALVRVVAGWTAVLSAFGALVVWEGTGLAVALVVVAGIALVRYRTRLRKRGDAAGSLLGELTRTLRRLALAVTDLLNHALDEIGARTARVRDRVRGWVRDAPRTPRELLALVRRGFERARTALWLYATVYRVGFVMLAVAEIAVATARWDLPGFVASVGGLVVLLVLVRLWRGRGADGVPGDDDPARAPGVTVERVDAGESVPSIRGLFRRFARWVRPGDWQTRTPGEVSRAAVERGFPEEPAEALTAAFRDVEYADEPAESRRERAKAAFDRLADARRRDGDEP